MKDKTELFKKLMQAHGVTYDDLGEELGKATSTVKQRVRMKDTFPFHEQEYVEAMEKCIDKNERLIAELWEEWNTL